MHWVRPRRPTFIDRCGKMEKHLLVDKSASVMIDKDVVSFQKGLLGNLTRFCN
jgi:hypothetical protein